MAKNKDVVFSSEREEARRERNKILIPIAAVLLLVILAVVLALVLRAARGASFAGPADASYPYSWSVNKKGVMTLELSTGDSDTLHWRSVSVDTQGVLEVTEPSRQPKQKHRFVLTPLETGRSLATFRLSDDAQGGSDVYELVLQLEVSRDEEDALTTALLNGTERSIQPSLEGGEETVYPYTISQNNNGELVIHCSTEGNSSLIDWQLSSDNEEAAVPSGVFSMGIYTEAFIRPGTVPGDAVVTLSSARAGTSIQMICKLGEDGSLTVLEHRIEGGTENVDWRNPVDSDSDFVLDLSGMNIDGEGE